MKEVKDIVHAFRSAEKAGKKTVLATVVHVEGSSYRRPGARMLVTEDGEITGAISGGCLEGDALRKALLAIKQRQNKLITYDTTEEDVELGVQLGCNGIVHILFEPADTTGRNAIFFLEKISIQRKAAVIVSVFSKDHQHGQHGTSFFYSDGKAESGLSSAMIEKLNDGLNRAVHEKSSVLEQISHEGEQLSALIEYIEPPVALVIAGAGNDAQPLAMMSAAMGWHTTILDGRPSHITAGRFPAADKLLAGKSAEAIPQIAIDNKTAVILMTHNFNYDLDLLELLIKNPPAYIGILGPRKKLYKMIDTLSYKGIHLTKDHLSIIHGPAGIDTGAEAPEEIAVSIIAEIQAVMTGSPAGFLKDKRHPIHKRISLSVHHE